jgi:hypothetical protein
MLHSPAFFSLGVLLAKAGFLLLQQDTNEFCSLQCKLETQGSKALTTLEGSGQAGNAKLRCEPATSGSAAAASPASSGTHSPPGTPSREEVLRLPHVSSENALSR